MVKTTISHQKNSSVSPIIFSSAYAMAGGLAITFGLLLVSAWMFTQVNLPAWAAVPISTTAVSTGSLLSSYILAKKLKQNGLFCGLCFGVFYFILYLFAALLNGQFDYTALSSIKFVCYVLSGCIGGFIGIVSNEKKSQRKRIH